MQLEVNQRVTGCNSTCSSHLITVYLNYVFYSHSILTKHEKEQSMFQMIMGISIAECGRVSLELLGYV